MATANSTRARGIKIEDYSWGRLVKGPRDMLIQNGYTQDGPFPGDPGSRKTSVHETDPKGRAINIQRRSKYLFVVLRDWNEDEAKAYRANVANNGSTPQSKPGWSAEQIKFLEAYNSLLPEQQAAFLAKHDTAPKRKHTNNVTGLQLVKGCTSNDTIEALEYLLHEARSGELIGLAYAGMLRGNACIVDAAGAATSNPIFALGMAQFLSNEIARRIKEPN